MDCLTGARQRLAAAAGVPTVLDAAYEAFEDVLAVLRAHQEDDEAALPAFVLAAAAAANGRDDIASAPGLPAAGPRLRAAGSPGTFSVAEVAAAVAALAGNLAARLAELAATAPDGEDRACCGQAAREAAGIRTLMGAQGPP